MAYQVGPLLRNPRFYNSGALELKRSLVYRSARKVPDPKPEALEEFIEFGVKPALAKAFPDGIDWDTPLDIVETIKACHFDKKKERAYLDAVAKMGLVDGCILLPRTVKAFIKLEFYADFSKEPRTIQCLPMTARVIALYYFKKLSDAFFSNHSVNIKHLPAAQRP